MRRIALPEMSAPILAEIDHARVAAMDLAIARLSPSADCGTAIRWT